MTHPDLGEWTPETLRVAIAEAVGWSGFIPNSGPFNKLIGVPPNVDEFMELPNYPSDLNAIHEAETGCFSDKAGDSLLNDWTYNLYQITRANAEDKDVALARATALQRSLVLARTLNLKPKK